MNDRILKTWIFQELTHLLPLLEQRRKLGPSFIALFSNASNYYICDVLRDLVLFVEFKKRVKHPCKSVTLGCNFTKINFPPRAFFTFIKLNKWHQIAQPITSIAIPH